MLRRRCRNNDPRVVRALVPVDLLLKTRCPPPDREHIRFHKQPRKLAEQRGPAKSLQKEELWKSVGVFPCQCFHIALRQCDRTLRDQPFRVKASTLQFFKSSCAVCMIIFLYQLSIVLVQVHG